MENLLDAIASHWMLIGAILLLVVIYAIGHYKGEQDANERRINAQKRHTKQLRFLKTSFQLSKKHKTHPKILRLLSGSERAPEITVTRFTLWNAGIDPITRDDVDIENPIRITCAENVVILGLESVYHENIPGLEFHFKPPNNIAIDFQAMNVRRGAVFQILHYGNGSGPQLQGKLKGDGIFEQAESQDAAPSPLKEFADIGHIK